MGYVSLDCEYKVGRQVHRYYGGRNVKDGEDFIAAEIAEIKKDHPKATNIVVKERPYNEGYPFALDYLIDRIREHRPDIPRETLEKHHWLILMTDRKEYQRGAYITTLPEAKVIFDDEDADFTDWVYLREFGIVIFNVKNHTSHQLFLSHWNYILSNILHTTKKWREESIYSKDPDASSEAFLHNKHGFFLSSAYGNASITKSADYKLNAQEKVIFGGYRFREIEPD